MTDDQRRLDNGLDSILESLAKLQTRVEQLAATVGGHEEILTLARDCAQRQQLSIETIGACVGDIDGKLRALDANDTTLQTELLQQRAAMALLHARVSVVIPHRGDVN